MLEDGIYELKMKYYFKILNYKGIESLQGLS